jgi:hypothetical protein
MTVLVGNLVVFHPSDYADGCYEHALVTKVWNDNLVNLVMVDRKSERAVEYTSVEHRSRINNLDHAMYWFEHQW